MGQKINPKANRLGYIQEWDSRWFPSLRETPKLIVEDRAIRIMVKERLKFAAISKVAIERAGSFLRVILHTARPGMVIGRRGVDIENLKTMIEEKTGKKTFVNVLEIKNPESDAGLVAESIAFQLERRVNHRRAMKKAIEAAVNHGVQGIKICVSGRLGGAEIARFESHREGRVPTSTFRADIGYGTAEALTAMGKIGVKVWIFKKEYFTKTKDDLFMELKKAKAQEMGIVEGPGIPLATLGAATPAAKTAPVEAKQETPAE